MDFFKYIVAASESSITWIVIASLLIWKVSAWKTAIEGRLSELGKKVDDVYKVIMSRFEHEVEQPGSPVTLIDYGKGLSQKINAEKIINKYVKVNK